MPASTPPADRRLARSAGSLLLILTLLLSACGGSTGDDQAAAPSDGDFPVTIDHVYGSSTIPARPERIVALGSGTDAEILYSLGLDPVGIATFPGFGAADADGVMPWVRPELDEEKTTLLPDGVEGVEQIAMLEPDLILVTYGQLEDDQYEQLSQIAPTVASPEGQWELDWRLELATVAEAVGLSDEGEEIAAGLDADIAAQRSDHEEFAGVDFSYVEVHSGGLWPYLSADPRTRLISELGLQVSPGIMALDEATDGAFVGDISFERAEELEADVIIAYTNEGDAASIASTPVFGDLEAVKRGSIAAYGQEDIEFLASLQPSPLTIPLAIEKVADDVAKALQNGS